MQIDALARLIGSTVFRFSGERGLQDGIESLFTKKGIAYSREVILSPRDRVDFLVGRIGVEVKVDSSLSVVQRQLWRYAGDERVESLLLVTTRAKHKLMPSELLGKPVLVAHLLASVF